MSSVEDTPCTEDLLSAALGQSGLTAFDCFSLSKDETAATDAMDVTSSSNDLPRSRIADSVISQEDVLGKKNHYARITVGGRKFLIPLERKKGSLQQLVLPTLKAPESSAQNRSRISTSGLKCLDIKENDLKQSSSVSVSKHDSELNTSHVHDLGRQLVESAVNCIDSHARNDSKIFVEDSSPTEPLPSSQIMQSERGRPVIERFNSRTLTQSSKGTLTEDGSITRSFLAATHDELTEEEEQETEEVANTYADYKPSKLAIGLPHPDSVVETSSLSSIPPPDVHYKLSLPAEVIDKGFLSALQLESITYSCQRHQQFLPSGERAGFLIGDGAGVGKGRTIAGIIYENYILGRKRALWFSVSNDLKYDSERDLRDIGAKNIQVHTLNKFKYGKISSRENSSVKKGVVFATYSSLISGSHSKSKYGTRLKQILHWCGADFDGVMVFDECHKAKNLVPTGSTKSTKTAFAVMELQKRLPNARVIYASATGASEPRNMAYMSRIGLWGAGTPFLDFGSFLQAVERRGVGAMELVAMDLKSRGAYIARQLSFHGVSFKIDEMKLSEHSIEMYNQAVRLWVAARDAFQVAADTFGAEYHMKKTMWGQFWAAHQRFFKYLCIAAKVDRTSQIAREAVKHGKCVVIGLQSTGEARTLDQLDRNGGELDDFVSTARGVFQSLVDHHFPAPNRERITDLFGKDFYGLDQNSLLKNKLDKNSGMKDDISDQSDSDDLADYSDEDIDKIFGEDSDSEDWGISESKKRKVNRHEDSSADCRSDEVIKVSSVKSSENPPSSSMKHSMCTASIRNKTVLTALSLNDCDPITKVHAIKQELLQKLECLDLPNNALDDLIDALGGPENVAEMTGRKGRVVLSDEGQVHYQSRSEREVGCNMLNLTEKQRFMDGEKYIAIISEAASSGISLQSDRRVRNQRRRLHITLELPWSADRAIQQFGRTHRSNQVNAPEYLFLITELAGERRFASVVAKRLESLGALTHGDRRATETRDLSRYNLDNKYGRLALDSVMKSLVGLTQPLVPAPLNYPGDFYREIREAMLGVGLISTGGQNSTLQLEKESCSIVKFLNRILGIEVLQQNAIFQYFSETLSAIVRQAKMEGQLDQGIKDVGSSQDQVKHMDSTRFELNSQIDCHGDGPSNNASYVELHTVKVERGQTWEKVHSLYSEAAAAVNDGFYLSRSRRNGNHVAILCIGSAWCRNSSIKKNSKDGSERYLVYRPNTGKQTKETLDSIQSKFQKVSVDDARGWWMKQYKASLFSCSHVYLQGACHSRNLPCIVGKSQLTYHILSGSVLAVWRIVEHVLTTVASAFRKIQIVRFVTKDGKRLVGLFIPEHCLDLLLNFLRGCISMNERSCNSLSDTASKHYGDRVKDDQADEDFSPDEFVSSVLFSS